MVECPVCGRDDFVSRNGMMKHHAHAHGELYRIEVKCDYCGQVKKKEPRRIDNTNHNFCDKDCEAKWRSDRFSGEGHPAWTGPRVEVECGFCGKTKKIRPKLAEEQDRHFCDVDCSSAAHSKYMSGESSPLWKGGPQPYGRGWNDDKKEAVRERDGRKCVQCGRTEEEHLEKFGEKHTVHHVHKARDVNDPEVRNAMENLVTLCRAKDCHWRWEGIPLRPQPAD